MWYLEYLVAGLTDSRGVGARNDQMIAALLFSIQASIAVPTTRYSRYHISPAVQEFIVAPASQLTPIPDAVPLSMAAPILCAGLTSELVLLPQLRHMSGAPAVALTELQRIKRF
jgi:hypothetical protein